MMIMQHLFTWLHRLRRRPFALWLLILPLLAGCANPELAAQWEQLVDQNRAILAAQGTDASNRLLVQGVDGNLYTVKPTGDARIALTNDATSLRQYVQPTWSPTGTQIAWTEIDNRGAEPKSALVLSRFDGVARTRIATPYAPFFIYWAPDGTHLAYLSNWQTINRPTIALRLVDPGATPPTLTTLAEGQPLYFTWSPASDRILAHISRERLEFRDLLGTATALTTTLAAFSTPQWSRDGSELLFADGTTGAQRLILTDDRGNKLQQITDFADTISFSRSPTDARIAYAITPTGIGTAAFGPLFVVDIATSATRQLTELPVLAFFWSPDGEKLAYLQVDNSSGSLQLRWYVWDGTRTRAYASIVPSRTFLDAYIVFFDQYARSMTLWSPDSQAFAYAAVSPTSGSTIFVQLLDADEPVPVGRGQFVSWSPR
jgi:Tol biopolymer transport system component